MDKFCCDYLVSRLSEGNVYIKYDSSFREFYLKRSDAKNVIYLIQFCPWCGKKLPKGLRNEWFDILEKEYKIETDIFEWRENKDIPQEFKSDEWWKKRGL
ncbi:DUF6980 family protein [endosymbiont GvMRE of Glomus versiforme]|uniref:DUF6980 family protein n=1 Tax=endosymbiont GvMRE of Glomus versiforme TaxID=2039283 RepID=UPI000EE43695|nr:hypothetical protein [endosymbiont GvMRE of Glomus versiforme]RHZ35546.1 hypothetical protein GvMRE_IIg203 [endosymbiont GvMRE of Glomus versiforme]